MISEVRAKGKHGIFREVGEDIRNIVEKTRLPETALRSLICYPGHLVADNAQACPLAV